MSILEVISFTGKACDCTLKFNYGGAVYETDTDKLLKSSCDTPVRTWGVQDIRWAFLTPDLSEEEKNLIVSKINEQADAIYQACLKCPMYQDLNGLPITEERYLEDTVDEKEPNYFKRGKI